jgi:hypothetical protein
VIASRFSRASACLPVRQPLATALLCYTSRKGDWVWILGTGGNRTKTFRRLLSPPRSCRLGAQPRLRFYSSFSWSRTVPHWPGSPQARSRAAACSAAKGRKPAVAEDPTGTRTRTTPAGWRRQSAREVANNFPRRLARFPRVSCRPGSKSPQLSLCRVCEFRPAYRVDLPRLVSLCLSGRLPPSSPILI